MLELSRSYEARTSTPLDSTAVFQAHRRVMSEHTETLDEPKTPMWLPALGAALFLIVGIWWAMRPSDAPAPSAEPAASASAGAPATATAAAVRPAVPGH
jgi:hypothetical protein